MANNNYIILSSDPLINGGVTPIQVTGPSAPAIPASGTVITSNGDGTSSWQTGGGGGGGPPTGTAGGDLGGTYPNPTVLSVAHVTTGTLPAANQAAQTLTGDVTGTTAANTVVKLTGVSGVVNFPTATTTATLGQLGTSSATQGANLTITPQQSTQATNNGGGNLIVALQTPLGTGTEAFMQFTRGGSVIGQIGAVPADSGTVFGIFNGNTATASNYVFATAQGGGSVSVNSPGTLQLQVVGANVLYVQSTSVNFAVPTVQWLSTVTTPTLAQQATATNSATGATLTVKAQNATGTTSIGGALVLAAGTGTSHGGAVQITGSQVVTAITVTTSTYTVDTLNTTADYVLLCNKTGTIGITLPAQVLGRVVYVKDISGAAGTLTNYITLTPASGTIDGASTYILNLNYASVQLCSNGTNWSVISAYSGSIV